MNSKRYNTGGRDKRAQPSSAGPSTFKRPAAYPAKKTRPRTERKQTSFQIAERDMPVEETSEVAVIEKTIRPFRVLIAVHRPRYRGRAERAAALIGWEVTSLLNKQDPVGIAAKAPGPPDIMILSGDFGRQRSYAIFRAVQQWRKKGLHIIGMVEDCETAPEGFPDSAPAKLCDICISPPYKTIEIRELLTRLYEKIRRQPAPKPISASGMEEEITDEEQPEKTSPSELETD